MTILRGSYQNGFAPRDGMPLYPSLWRGCVGAWAPCLGPSGVTLRDWSGYANHGTLTNMATDSDWIISGGCYSLDFDGLNDHVALSDLPATTVWTVAAWILMRTIGGYQAPVCIRFGTVGNNGIYHRASAIGVMQNDVFRGQSGGFAYAVNTWYHYTATWSGSSARLFVNGRQVSSLVPDDAAWAVSGTKIGDGYSTNKTNGQIDDVRVYNRVLSPNEISLLASRRGIAYDLAPMMMPHSEQSATFRAAWALRQRLILGGGGGMG